MRAILPAVAALLLLTASSAQAGGPSDARTGSSDISISSVSKFLIPLALLSCGDDQENERSKGWFGVRLSVPDAPMIKQLGLADGGLLITNICKGSPAEQAGLQQFDVVMRFDGQDVGSDTHELAQKITQLGAGFRADLLILRDANEMHVTATLGHWPEKGHWGWLHEEAPEVVFTDKYVFGGKILRRGPDGKMIVQDIGLTMMPKELKAFLPNFKQRKFELLNQDGSVTRKWNATKDEVEFEIEQDTEGRITVKRTTLDGLGDDMVDEQTYLDEEELKQQDDEAYEILKGFDSQDSFVHLRLQQPNGRQAGAPSSPVWRKFGSGKSVNPLHSEDLKKWIVEIGQGLGELDIAEREKLHQLFGEFKKQIEQDQWHRSRAPRYSFAVDPAGQITATIRKGDSELRKTYRNLDEMKQKNFRLYERYEDLEASE